MSQRRIPFDSEQIGACTRIPPRSRSKRTGSPVSRTVIGRHKGGRRMADPTHAGDASQSEALADDEDGWAKSSTDETDSYLDHAATFATLAKRRSSRSGSGSEHISEHDRTPQPKKRFRLSSDSPTDRIQDPMATETVITPRATASGPTRGKGNRTRTRDSRAGVRSMTDAGPGREEGTSICAGSSGIRKDPCDRSSPDSELGRSLPADEHTHDPGDFYASDSPVFDNSDSDQELYKSAEDFADRPEPEDQGGEQAGANSAGVRAPQELPAQPMSLPQPSLPRVNQHHGMSLEGHFNADGGQRGSHVPIIDIPGQTVQTPNRNPRNMCSSGQKARRRSPQRRGTKEKSLSKLVRDELASLLEAKPPYGRIPERSQVVEFEAEWERTGHGAKACEATTTDFMVDVVGTPKSPWNVSAGRAFTSYLIEKMGYDDVEEMRKMVERAFSTRVKGLKSLYNRDLLSQAEKSAEKSKHSRHQRKYQLYHRRRRVAKLYEPLQRHEAVLDALGVDGMSSDESDVDPTTNQMLYTVVKPDWRHPDLHQWLKIFDQLYHRAHLHHWSNDRRGAFPHMRVGSQKIHKKMHAPPHLPVNAYNPQWLEAREALYVKHDLCPSAETYDFNHALDVIGLLAIQP